MGDVAARRNSGNSAGGSWQPRGRGRGFFRGNGNSGGRFNGNQANRAAGALATLLPGVDTQSSQQVITDLLEVNQGPYSGWKLYHKQESPHSTEQRKRRSPNWGEAETLLLLRLWAERVQEMKTTKRNGFMLEEMAQLLQTQGFSRSSTEVKTRIANLSQEYRMELRKRSLGFPHGSFKLWDAVHAILGPEESANYQAGGEIGLQQGNSSEQTEQQFMAENWQQEQQEQQNFKEGSETVVKTRAAESYISRHSNDYRSSEVEERRAFAVDLRALAADEEFSAAWPKFQQELEESPELTLGCLGLAMHQIVVKALREECARHLPPGEQPPPVDLPVVRARIIGHQPIIQLKQLKANFYGKLVTVRGTIIRVGGLRLLCSWLSFSCGSCGAVQAVRQPEGQFTPPSRCVQHGCRARSFMPLQSHHLTQTTNWQTVKLQEIVDDDQREGGRVPRTLEVELTEDLVESCVPGDDVTITGIVKVQNNEEAARRKSAGPSMFLLYLNAVSVTSCKHSGGGLAVSGDIRFNMQDYYAIQEIHGEPELFRLLVASLCPAIYGHEMVKAGLLLALLGGTPREPGSGRSDAHVLVVGDPGLGKSQMLHAVSNIAPRGVYVCGNTSTAAGLTVTLTRESGGDFALEAGALVLADQGCCCIDEFDKMSSQHQALLEAMEQQSVSVAKAGVVCSLPARASVLAAANPVGGHYNRAKTVAENLRMGPALLSRFDLVFILLDQPNEQLDSLLSEHIMALHSGGRRARSTSQLNRSQADSTLSSFSADQPLSERLKAPPGEKLDVIPPALLRKFVAYARKYVRPRLSKEAAAVLQKFYLKLRAHRGSQDCTPVTTRQLESLIRLTEARAKLELREEASEEDAQDVVELMKHSLLDTFCDELGALDFQRSQNGSGTSTKNQAKKFISALQRRAELQSKSMFTVSEMKEVAGQARIVIPDMANFLATLNHQGYLIKKGANLYQLLTVDY